MTASKVGLDDYFVRGGTRAGLIAAAVPLASFAQERAADADAVYAIDHGQLIWHKRTNDGPVPVVLANFSARITADIVQDDGVETVRLFELEAILRTHPYRFTVPAAQFAGLSWVAEQLGAGAIVEPGLGLKERTRVAIQVLSPAIIARTEYAHTGWRRIGDAWLYLHGAGAIGPDGPVPEVIVSLSGNLGRYQLPPPPAGAELVTAVRASLALLDRLPFSVAVPLLAATWLAPLRELLTRIPPDFVPWLHGPSGTFKSELAALAQSHFGDFPRPELPAAFTATPNAIERLLSAAKDALLVVDDYHPASDAREAGALAQVAARLLRGVGNSAGRMRMRQDTSLRPELRPRGMVLVTGERLPDGHSTAARMFPVAVTPGSVDATALTAAQDQRDQYPLAMAGYLQYLASRIDALRAQLAERFTTLRQHAARSGGHAREPGQVAHLQLGLECWLRFAAEIGALTATQRDDLLSRSWVILLGHAAEHGQNLAEETPVRRFLALLADGFASKEAYLEAPGGGAPAESEHWGWELTPARDFDDTEAVRHRPAATLLGILTEEWLLLSPDVTYQFIQQRFRAAGGVFPVDKTSLLRRLDEAGLIVTEASERRRTVNVRIGLETRRVIKLARSALTLVSPSEPGEQREHGEQEPNSSTGRGDSADESSGNTDDERGNTGNNRHSQLRGAVRTVPGVPPVPAGPEERDGDGAGEEVVEWMA